MSKGRPLVRNWDRWSEISQTCWRRDDGAVVKFDTGPAKLQWIAFEPDPSNAYLSRPAGRSPVLTVPRRWRTAEAAMNAVDVEHPIGNQKRRKK